MSAADVHTWLRAKGLVHRRVDELGADPSFAGPAGPEADLWRSAQWLAATLRGRVSDGAGVGTNSAPTVWTQWCTAPGAATVLCTATMMCGG